MTSPGKKVLLVDDEEKLLNSIAQRMKILGFTPLTATKGAAALDIAAREPIDLAIVDLQMPDMDGLVVITKLKEIEPSLKTVLLTLPWGYYILMTGNLMTSIIIFTGKLQREEQEL